MGEQVVSIARVLGELDLAHPWGEQETFFSIPVLGFLHYPQKWVLPLAVTAGLVLVAALGLALWKKLIDWRGLAFSFGAVLVAVAVSAALVAGLLPRLPGWFGWKTYLWEEWPEVIPPNGGLAAGILGLLVLALSAGVYALARRWSARANFSLFGLLPFAVLAVVLAAAEPRTAYAFTWPVLVASLVWIAAVFISQHRPGWSSTLPITLAAVPLVVIFLPFLPGIIMADGMKSLAILAGIEALLLVGSVLPAVDILSSRYVFTRRPVNENCEKQRDNSHNARLKGTNPDGAILDG
jgi:hypothetical protein